MKKKVFVGITAIVLFLVCFIVWYVNFPGYKNIAEDRIDTYMEAQKVDLEQGYQKRSSRDFKTGRWMIVYKFAEEPNLIYEYEYDRNTNSVLLIVFESPTMNGGSSIEKGMHYPSLEDGWSKFDSKGNLILKSD
ncbi:DUF3139 domain-containing protein [Mesobacillus subterraneus]|uniref:DUF3139 domain-containing protein n=1 Tax=Mesobacillus subterraneus TaxID=285983 RepID=UPI00203D6C16|nr:DUF3139 domain-containing protein [Mesobacillus subterraneus]MCM3666262.1 DUF3139 domain-containing protein [Mesobacillus subterraneus]MCM3685261.1 DUF3139 domain-containing protein [Mesobacillus subterraneus]